jgi:hypothetical protein
MKALVCLAVTAGFVVGLAAQTDETKIPPNFRIDVQHAPTVRGAIDLLARGVVTVDNSTNLRFNRDEKALSTTIQHVKDLEGENLKSEIDDLKSQFEDFRTTACPVLKNASLENTQKKRVDKLCGAK